MLAIADVKMYLRIDGNAEDRLLNRLITTAEAYMRGAVTDFDAKIAKSSATDADNFSVKAETAELAIISELYEHRTAPDKQADFSYTVRSLITQLQYDTEFDTTEATT